MNALLFLRCCNCGSSFSSRRSEIVVHIRPQRMLGRIDATRYRRCQIMKPTNRTILIRDCSSGRILMCSSDCLMLRVKVTNVTLHLPNRLPASDHSFRTPISLACGDHCEHACERTCKRATYDICNWEMRDSHWLMGSVLSVARVGSDVNEARGPNQNLRE